MKYKITRSYTVEAKSRSEARAKFAELLLSGQADDYLEFESVREAEPTTNGWADAVKQQILGSKKD